VTSYPLFAILMVFFSLNLFYQSQIQAFAEQDPNEDGFILSLFKDDLICHDPIFLVYGRRATSH